MYYVHLLKFTKYHIFFATYIVTFGLQECQELFNPHKKCFSLRTQRSLRGWEGGGRGLLVPEAEKIIFDRRDELEYVERKGYRGPGGGSPFAKWWNFTAVNMKWLNGKFGFPRNSFVDSIRCLFQPPSVAPFPFSMNICGIMQQVSFLFQVLAEKRQTCPPPLCDCGLFARELPAIKTSECIKFVWANLIHF